LKIFLFLKLFVLFVSPHFFSCGFAFFPKFFFHFFAFFIVVKNAVTKLKKIGNGKKRSYEILKQGKSIFKKKI
jgi:hypothetical protein